MCTQFVLYRLVGNVFKVLGQSRLQKHLCSLKIGINHPFMNTNHIHLHVLTTSEGLKFIPVDYYKQYLRLFKPIFDFKFEVTFS